MKKLNVGVIGCGSIARKRHIPEFKANPRAEYVGCYDMNLERASYVQENFGGRIYASIEEMLADPAIDAVSVCTSNATHAPVTIDALNKGKAVLCEKPMATSYEECLAMEKTAQECGKLLMIAHNQRFAAAHVKAKELLDSGSLGKVISFQTTFGHRGPEFWSADQSVNTWFFDKTAASMGATADLGIHKLDLIMFLLSDTVQSVSAITDTLDKKDSSGNRIGVDDNMVSILRMKKGAIGTLVASWTYYGDEDNSTVLYCENGILRIYDNPQFPIEVVMKDRSRAYYEVGMIQNNDEKVQANSGVIDAFVDAAIDGTKPAVPLDEAIGAMKAIFACLESSSSKKSVEL
jgi:predicted dehydrogenase